MDGLIHTSQLTRRHSLPLMDTQLQARIFLADQRGRSESDSLFSDHTFNDGAYRAEGREPFGPLSCFNEHTLRAGTSLTIRANGPTQVVLLPISGGLDYSHAGTTTPLEPGQAGVVMLEAGMTGRVSNPYGTETINFLQLGLTQSPPDYSPVVESTDFNLSQPNTLMPFFGKMTTDANQPSGHRGFMGRYEGRGEGTYAIGEATNRQPRLIFIFVVQGVFEVANRLLHAKDGLALVYSQGGMLDFEALSNDALLMLLDLNPAT